MRRISLGLALLASAFVAVGCGQGKSGGNAAQGPTDQAGQTGLFYTVTLAKPVGGNVTSDIGGINCGDLGSVCTANILWFKLDGTTLNPVKLTAAPSASFSFDVLDSLGKQIAGWAGACAGNAAICTIQPGADQLVSAIFVDPSRVPTPAPTPGKALIYGVFTYAGGTLPAVDSTLLRNGAGLTLPYSGKAVNICTDAACANDLNAAGKTTALGAISLAVDAPATYYFKLAGVGFLPGSSATAVAIPVAVGQTVDLSLVTAVAAPAPAATAASLAASPLVLAGFNKPVTLTCNTSGFPPSAGATFTFTQTTTSGGSCAPDAFTGARPAGCFQVTLSGSGNTRTFTTPTYRAMVEANAVNGFKFGGVENRPGLMPITFQNVTDISLSFTCKVVDPPNTPAAGLTSSAMVVRPVGQNYVQPGDTLKVVAGTGGANTASVGFGLNNANVLAGAVTVLNDRFCTEWADEEWRVCKTSLPEVAANFAWSNTVKPACAGTVTVNDPNSRNAWFVAPCEGLYTFVNGAAGGGTVSVYASASWVGSDATVNRDANGNVTSITNKFGCAVCHDGNNNTNVVAKWSSSKHSTIFADGMSEGTHYGQSCLGCHTVGFNDLAPGSQGFDDMAAAQGWNAAYGPFNGLNVFGAPQAWSMPPVPQAPSAANSNLGMGQALYARGRINCENCHGPGNLHQNNVGVGTVPPDLVLSKSMDSRICSGCHSNGSNHAIFDQWNTSGHSNLEVAAAEGLNSTSCQRCHAAQGYLVYVADLQAGNPNSLKTDITNVSGATVKDNAINANNIQPITCQTCHDPHTLGPRIEVAQGGAPILLPGGFTIDATVGAGGTCISCHNSRNANSRTAPSTGNVAPASGTCKDINNVVIACPPNWLQHLDSIPLTEFNYGSRTLTGPHEAAQGDVYMGGNGYLLGAADPGPNFHRDQNFFQDSCKKCHIELFPSPWNAAFQTIDPVTHNPIPHTWLPNIGIANASNGTTLPTTACAYEPGVTPSVAAPCLYWRTAVNHTFKVDEETCVECHGQGVELPQLETAFDNYVTAYKLKAVQVLNAAGVKYVGTPAVTVAAGAVTKAAGTSVTVTAPGHLYQVGQAVTVSVSNNTTTGSDSTTLTATIPTGGVFDPTGRAANAADNTKTPPVPANTATAAGFVVTAVAADTFTYTQTASTGAGTNVNSATFNIGGGLVQHTGAALSATTPYDAVNSVDVSSHGAIVGFEKVNGRPMDMLLTFQDGFSILTQPNDIFSAGGTPVLYTLDGTKLWGQQRVYGKFMKALYNYWLVSYDLSDGAHNPPFVQAMLKSMVSNLATP